MADEPTRQELIDGVQEWMKTGYGIDPNQIAMRHYPGDAKCECFKCAGTPVIKTKAPYEPTGERVWRIPS